MDNSAERQEIVEEDMARRDRRERIAAKVLAGIAASPKEFTLNGKSLDPCCDFAPSYAYIAVHLADALIAELEK